MTIVAENFREMLSEEQFTRLDKLSDQISGSMLNRIINKVATGKDEIINDLAIRALGQLESRILEQAGDNPFVQSVVNTTLNYSRAQVASMLGQYLRKYSRDF